MRLMICQPRKKLSVLIIRRCFGFPPGSTFSLASKLALQRQQSLDHVKDSWPKREEKRGAGRRERNSVGRAIHHDPSFFKAWLTALQVKYVKYVDVRDGGAGGGRAAGGAREGKEGAISEMKGGKGEGQGKKEGGRERKKASWRLLVGGRRNHHFHHLHHSSSSTTAATATTTSPAAATSRQLQQPQQQPWMHKCGL